MHYQNGNCIVQWTFLFKKITQGCTYCNHPWYRENPYWHTSGNDAGNQENDHLQWTICKSICDHTGSFRTQHNCMPSTYPWTHRRNNNVTNKIHLMIMLWLVNNSSKSPVVEVTTAWKLRNVSKDNPGFRYPFTGWMTNSMDDLQINSHNTNPNTDS